MKTFPFSLMILVILLNWSTAVSQADCGYSVLVDIRDDDNRPVHNARLSLNGWKVFNYSIETGTYRASGLLGVGAPVSRIRLKVSAKGFKSFDEVLNIRCSHYEYRLIMRRKSSKRTPELISTLTIKN